MFANELRRQQLGRELQYLAYAVEDTDGDLCNCIGDSKRNVAPDCYEIEVVKK